MIMQKYLSKEGTAITYSDFDQQEVNKLFNYVGIYERPDILSIYDNKIVAIEHFEFDSYKNTRKKVAILKFKKVLLKKNKLKDNEIDELKEENNSLFAELNYFKNKFIRLIQFIKNGLFNRKDRDKYHDFSRDLYEHGIIEHDTIKELNETYKFSKEHDLSKEKDDYDLEI